MPNHLASSTSPYLLQHSNNPVDWYPWSDEALEKARQEDKLIFLSIGYAACHWCHVMAHESFEDPQVADLMNQYFISIKVDREERPDLDGIYMQAVTALTGQGGWPMSVFLTPDLHPFYGGTYFPPEARYGMPSFKQVLTSLAEAWHARRDEIDQVGGKLAAQLQAQVGARAAYNSFKPEDLGQAVHALLDTYDWANGGWGQAPKFPPPMLIEFLLRRAARDNNRGKRGGNKNDARAVATHALHAMARGGMYDVIGGGFARYSTDIRWLVPHFEKMLYDNAQLALVYLHAWQLTGDPAFRRVVTETLDFIARELTSPQGGFYSSLDADSEGQEGKFYVWTLDQIRDALGDETEFFITAYGVTSKGNWEGKTILQRALDDASLAARFGLNHEGVAAKLSECHARLLIVREERPRPATDDKVLTAWNALALRAFAEAARALDDRRYHKLAERDANFLLSSLRPDGCLRRSWREGQTTSQVFLEDYAALIIALLELYQTDFNPSWFAIAMELTDEMLASFADSEQGFFDTLALERSNVRTLLMRPKDLQDHATPSGNALAVEALAKIAAFTEGGQYRELAEKALMQVAEVAPRYPTAFAHWLCIADFALSRVKQVAIVGDLLDEATQALIRVVREGYRPNLVLAASNTPPPEGSPELLSERPLLDKKPTAYACQGFICGQPTTNVDELREELTIEEMRN
jgi:uncharacterized protein YyaL (SSP411 family)